jgi:hypothetical protein
VVFTKEFISKASLLKNLPLPLFSKEGHITSLWQREVRRDFIINVFILMTLLVKSIRFQWIVASAVLISVLMKCYPVYTSP